MSESGGTFGDPLAPVLQILNNHHAAHGILAISLSKLSVSVSAGARKRARVLALALTLTLFCGAGGTEVELFRTGFIESD